MANCLGNGNVSDFNFNEICRLCLTREGEMSPIFSRPSDVKSISIPYRIMAFTSIKLETGDGLPGLICHSCLFNVERVYEFKQQCEQSDAFLRKHFAPISYQDVKLEPDDVKLFNSNNCLDVCNDLLNESKVDEDNEGVVKSPLKQGSFDKDGIESVVMVVDPNAKTLDASMSDNDNDNHIDNDDDSQFSRKSDLDVEPVESNWIETTANNLIEQHIKDQTSFLLNCPSCNKPFIDENLLERHKMIHNQEPFFPCDYCELVFNDRAALKSHWRDHAGLGKLTCMTCGEAYVDRSALTQHVSIHDATKPYHCIVCNRAFSNRSDLRKHLIIHTGARPYICDVCGKSFTRSTNLNKHARAHAGNRPFDCPECSKKFSTRADLTRHSVTHTGEKPYSCPVCGLAFSRRDKLTRHIKLHEKNNRPFFCDECSLSFNNRKVFASHYQIHHKNLEIPKEIKNAKEFREFFEVNAKNSNSSIMRNLLTTDKVTTNNQDSEDVINIDPFQLNKSNNADVGIVETSQQVPV